VHNTSLCRPDSHPYRVTNTSVTQIQQVLLMMGTQLPKTCREVEINILRSSVHLVGFIWKRSVCPASFEVFLTAVLPQIPIFWGCCHVVGYLVPAVATDHNTFILSVRLHCDPLKCQELLAQWHSITPHKTASLARLFKKACLHCIMGFYVLMLLQYLLHFQPADQV